MPSDAADAHTSTLKFLITTDNHLGYAERDARRGDDSFTTFEEILRAARVEHDVDAVLLGGDLFHENKPSLGCMTRTCSLFRKYVLGNKPIEMELLSNPQVNFPTHALPMANFHDPNINVALPVFAIHGNHDDPVGGTSALDVLATGGYLNYFGQVSSLEEIVLEPILLRKGSTHVALYGLGNIRDERLHRCFQLHKVHFRYPAPAAGRRWFNILLLHQNRGLRGGGGPTPQSSRPGVYEQMLAGFGMDVVIWGNEHEQRIVPEPSHGYDIIQPGSTVLTSLSAQECHPKRYGIVEVRGNSYRVSPFPLRSMRPVVRHSVTLRTDYPHARTRDAVEEVLHGEVRRMLREADEQVRHIPDDVKQFHPAIVVPLLRLSVDFRDAESAPFPQPNPNRFGQMYMDVVANPGDLLRPIRPRVVIRSAAPTARDANSASTNVLVPSGGGSSAEELRAAAHEEELIFPHMPALHTRDIRVRVAEVFQNNAKDACTLLSEPEVSTAVYAFAEKGERDAIDERMAELLDLAQRSVWSRMDNGAAEGVLRPEAIRAEVVSHKRAMNERYARVHAAHAEREGAVTPNDASTTRAHDHDDTNTTHDSHSNSKNAIIRQHSNGVTAVTEGVDYPAKDVARERMTQLSEIFDSVMSTNTMNTTNNTTPPTAANHSGDTLLATMMDLQGSSHAQRPGPVSNFPTDGESFTRVLRELAHRPANSQPRTSTTTDARSSRDHVSSSNHGTSSVIGKDDEDRCDDTLFAPGRGFGQFADVDLEELPGDGLQHIPVDRVLAKALRSHEMHVHDNSNSDCHNAHTDDTSEHDTDEVNMHESSRVRDKDDYASASAEASAMVARKSASATTRKRVRASAAPAHMSPLYSRVRRGGEEKMRIIDTHHDDDEAGARGGRHDTSNARATAPAARRGRGGRTGAVTHQASTRPVLPLAPYCGNSGSNPPQR